MTLMMWNLIEGCRQQSRARLVVAGLLWGIAILTRAVCFAYGPAVVVWLFLVMPHVRARMTAIAAVAIPCALVMAPWSIRTSYVHGRFVPLSTQAGLQLFISNNPLSTGVMAIDQEMTEMQLVPQFSWEPNEAIRDKRYQREAVKFIRENPGRFLQLCFIRFTEFWKIYSPRVPLVSSLAVIASFGLAIPFFLIQAIRKSWRPEPEMLFVMFILSQTMLHMVFGAIARYRISIEPAILAMAFCGVMWLVARGGNTDNAPSSILQSSRNLS